MATINLGAIKFNWKGAYSGATAYVVDDVVESGGNSYVCIAATTGNTPPNATYWELMAQAGTNGTDGTDLTSTLTTQGDILYRDGSGLARLGAGTSGQALITGGTGANPSWGDVSGGLIQTQYYNYTGVLSATNQSWQDLGSFSVSITPTSTSSKILVHCTFGRITGGTDGANTVAFRITRNGTAVGIGNVDGNRERMGWSILGANYSSSNHADGSCFTYIDAPATTSTLTYKVQNYVENGTLLLNRNEGYSNDSSIYNGTGHSTFYVQEIS